MRGFELFGCAVLKRERIEAETLGVRRFARGRGRPSRTARAVPVVLALVLSSSTFALASVSRPAVASAASDASREQLGRALPGAGGVGVARRPVLPLPRLPLRRRVPHRRRLLFDDEFTGSSLNDHKWITCYPWSKSSSGCTNVSNHEQEWYRRSQDVVRNGRLHLIAEHQDDRRFPYVSGMVATAGKFSFTYGTVEIRAKMPSGDQMWPALWMLPSNQAWPPEIDIVEVLGQQPATDYMTYHSPTREYQRALRGVRTTGWNVYAIRWTPRAITWYLDGRKVYAVTSSVPSTPMYLLADLAVGGTWPGHVTRSTPRRAEMQLDWVRVYANASTR